MKKINLQTLISLGLMLLFSHTLIGQTTTLTGLTDGTAIQSTPDQSVSHGSNIFIYKTADDEAISFIRFDLSKYSNQSVESASFSTQGKFNTDGLLATLQLTEAGSADFTRDGLTWNNKPSAGSELATVILDNSSSRKTYANTGSNLVDYINEALRKGQEQINFAIKYKEGDQSTDMWMGGLGDGSYGPQLSVTFTDEMSYYAADDGSAIQSTPDQPEPANTNISVFKTVDDEAIAYIKFNLKGMAYKAVEVAELSVIADMNDAQTMTVSLKGSKSADFTRSALTWNNKPGRTGEIATLILDDDSKRKTFSPVGDALVAFINGELMKGNEEIGFAIQYKEGAGDQFKWMGGKGDGNYGPMLDIVPAEMYGSYSVDDGAAFEATPDQNVNDAFGATNIAVYATDTDTAIAFVKFNIDGLKGRQIETADFSVIADMQDGQTMTVALHSSDTNFTRTDVTWNNMPSVGSNELANLILDDESNRKSFVDNGGSLVDYINSALLDGDEMIAFAIKYKEGAGDQFKWMGGKGDATYGPMLKFTFSDQFSGYGIDDATALEADPDASVNTIHSSNIFMYKKAEGEAIAFVKYDIASLKGKIAKEVNFSTQSSMNSGMSMTVSLNGCEDTTWTRESLTWNNKPATGDELATVIMDDQSSRKYYTSTGTAFLDYVNNALAMNKDYIAFALTAKEGDVAELSWCGGIGDGSYGPMFEVTLKGTVEYDTLPRTHDTYVAEDTPDDNFDGQADMNIHKDTDNNGSNEVYLKFDISEVEEEIVGSAMIRLYITQHNGSVARDDFFVDVFAVEDQSWDEKDLTWNTKPEAGQLLIEENVSWWDQGTDTVWTSDAFTHYINNAIQSGMDSVSFVIKGKNNTGDDRLFMSDKSYKEFSGQLILDYVSLPPVQNMPVIQDAYVSQVDGEQDSNFGGEADQHLINDDANNSSKWIFMKYDISNAYDEAVTAMLTLYGSIHESASGIEAFDYEVYSADNTDWTEDAITWNTKPSANSEVLLTGTLVSGGDWYNLSSAAFTDYVNNAIKSGKDSVTIVVKGAMETPENRAWMSGKEWRASYLSLNYEPVASMPVFMTNPGEYIPSVDVELTSATAGGTIYYTTDGSEPTDASTEYTGPFTLTESTTVKAITYATNLKPSLIASVDYTVKPVSNPMFSKDPNVKYQNQVTVELSALPEDAKIRYSDDGSDPATLYDGPITLSASATIKAQAFTSDFTQSSEVVSADYEVLNTINAPGNGPAGVGFMNLTYTNQPELGLWLKPENMLETPMEDSIYWADASGNENHAYNTYVEGGSNGIPNTAESEKPVPTMLSSELNDNNVFSFGAAEGEKASLVVPDADELDGGPGVTMFVVMKRNEILDDFSAIIQKRDIRGSDPELQSYVMEINSGGDPHTIQFVMKRELFVRTSQTFESTEPYHILGFNYNSSEGKTKFLVNGMVDGEANYSKTVNATEAPVIIGGFQAMNIAEVVIFNSEVNQAQVQVVNNYLAAKYDLSLSEGSVFTPNGYDEDVIGIGAIADGGMHNNSANELLVLNAESLSDGTFVMAGHNGSGEWYIEKTGTAALSLDVGIIGGASDDDLMYKANENDDWTSLDIAPAMVNDTAYYTVDNFETGYYKSGTGVGTDDLKSQEMFTLYPNPASNRINVQIADQYKGKVQMKIMDNSGRVIESTEIVKQTHNLNHPIDLNQYEKGFYLITITQGNNTDVKTFLVQ